MAQNFNKLPETLVLLVPNLRNHFLFDTRLRNPHGLSISHAFKMNLRNVAQQLRPLGRPRTLEIKVASMKMKKVFQSILDSAENMWLLTE